MPAPVIAIGWTLAKGSRALLTATRIFRALDWAKTVIDLVKSIREVPDIKESQPAQTKELLESIVPDILQYIACAFYMQTRSLYETLGVKMPTPEEWMANLRHFPDTKQFSLWYEPDSEPHVQWEIKPAELAASFKVDKKALLELPGWLPCWGQFEGVTVEGQPVTYYYYSQEAARVLAWPWRDTSGNAHW